MRSGHSSSARRPSIRYTAHSTGAMSLFLSPPEFQVSALCRRLVSAFPFQHCLSPPYTPEAEGFHFRENLGEGRKISALWAGVPGGHLIRECDSINISRVHNAFYACANLLMFLIAY
ncbi:hypothetical protein EVAR_9764_1 [Eumeta japonica]|uniref:Uncharacterized protein n=1 Tax=Eumeta variegata TaxID=151549 RepID=A0A4C1U5J9_EUMVA|nr:hypothetical protein EVAR_9764_1 [Eumeta japonica]